MNYKNTTLAIAAIVAAVAITAIAFAIPQQAFAHYGHHNHNSNSITVDQNTTQVNLCDQSLCGNQADNSADIHR
jgi:conjugal transfer/entry exclusion protein